MFIDTIDRDCVLIPTDFYITNWKNFHMDYHCHERRGIEINYVTKGKCEYHVNGTAVKMKSHNLVVIDPAVPHKLVFSGDEPCLVMGFVLDAFSPRRGILTFGELLEAYDSLSAFLHSLDEYVLMQDGHLIYPIMKNLFAELKERKNRAYASLLADQILVNIARMMERGDHQIIDYVEQVKTYIFNHYYDIDSVDDIASAVGLNKSYLQKIFREQTGSSLWNYLTDTRLNYAASTLVNTEMTVEQIYESIGVNSRQSFNGMFKKKFGMTPLEFREKNTPDLLLNGKE